MSDIPKTCMAAVLEEYNKPLQIREVEIPRIGPEPSSSRWSWPASAAPTCTSRRASSPSRARCPTSRVTRPSAASSQLGRGADERRRRRGARRSATASCGRTLIAASATGATSPATRSCARARSGLWLGSAASRSGAASPNTSTSLPRTNVVRVPDELTEEEAVGVGCAFRSVIGGYRALRQGGPHGRLRHPGLRPHRPVFDRGRSRERRPHDHRGRGSGESSRTRQEVGRGPRHQHRRAQRRRRAPADDPRADPRARSGERRGGLRAIRRPSPRAWR